MTSEQLKIALHLAMRRGDAESLRALALAESSRADQMGELLIAVLRKTGPVEVKMRDLESAREGSFSIAMLDAQVLTGAHTGAIAVDPASQRMRVWAA